MVSGANTKRGPSGEPPSGATRVVRFRSMAGFARPAGADQDVEQVAGAGDAFKVAGFLDRRATDLVRLARIGPGQ